MDWTLHSVIADERIYGDPTGVSGHGKRLCRVDGA
jgi:hypothetical protein